jgi:hypothetical protein
MVFEDAHWSDPTSLELFGRGVSLIANLAVLLLITFRPEFEPPWIGQPHVTALTLNRLTRREIEALIDHVAGNKPMPANIRQEISCQVSRNRNAKPLAFGRELGSRRAAASRDCPPDERPCMTIRS